MSREEQIEKLAHFVEALQEWGSSDYREIADEILKFQEGGYDLTGYEVAA